MYVDYEELWDEDEDLSHWDDKVSDEEADAHHEDLIRKSNETEYDDDGKELPL